jgi:oligoendopeptidase F
MGHALHSHYSNKTQKYPNADYSIFVAEVASTFNESLLMDYMIQNTQDDSIRLSLLMEKLDGYKGTLFRQTQFAEFELEIHQRAEAGEALSNDILNEIYGKLLNKYYGKDLEICEIDNLYHLEWAYIPHFYMNFYVYQYATSFTASSVLAGRVLGKENGSVEKYLQFISSGASKYPIELLKDAGVDMTKKETFTKAISTMQSVMDEIDIILKNQGK